MFCSQLRDFRGFEAIQRVCTVPCIWVNFSLNKLQIWVNFSLKGSFIMSILLGLSYLFCSFMSQTKHEANPGGFGYWDLLRNQKDKSSYLIFLFNTLSHSPPCCTFMMSQFPSPAGLSRSGKVGHNHVHSCFAAAQANDQTRSLSIPLLLSSLCSGLQELFLLPGSLAKIFFIPGPTFLSVLLLLLGSP